MRLWFGALVAILLIGGGMSYLASASPDGLDAATQRGCQLTVRDGAPELTGHCIAQSVREHPMAASPLADYTVSGAPNSVGAAGVIGVLVTLGVAGGLFGLIARRGRD